MKKKLTGFDRTTRRWRDDIFGSGFEAGAKARVAAGIPSPSNKPPKRSAKIPSDCTGRNAKTLWASGWKSGYAFGIPNTRNGNARERQRTLAWRRMIAKRGRLRINSDDLVGRWRACRGEYVKLWELAQDGSATGRVTKARTVIAHASGTWKLDKDCLVFDYRHDLHGGEMNAPYEDTSVVMEIARDRLVLATTERIRERYIRVPQKI